MACDGIIHYLLLIEKLELIHDTLRGAKHIKVIRNDRDRKCTVIPLQNISQLCMYLGFDDVDVSFVSLIPDIGRVS